MIDTSALIAILFDERDAEELEAKISEATRRYVSAVSLVETHLVFVGRFGPDKNDLDELISGAGIEVVEFTSSHAETARRAFIRFGKGRHRASLNFGDCCAYAAAIETGEPLLFKGEDFNHTDVRPVE